MTVSLVAEDWEELFPTRPFPLGKTTLEITALGLAELSNVIRHGMVLREVCVQEGINLQNWRSPEVMQKMAILLVEELPELLSTMSGLDAGDVPKLPLTVALSLAAVCLDVNIESAEGLVKNFKALSDKLHLMGNAIPMVMEAANNSQ